jgi:hypothetical protein
VVVDPTERILLRQLYADAAAPETTSFGIRVAELLSGVANRKDMEAGKRREFFLQSDNDTKTQAAEL